MKQYNICLLHRPLESAVPAFLARKAVHGVLEGIAEAGRGFGKQRCKPSSPIGVRFVRASEQYLAMSYREFEFQGRTWQADVWCFIEVPRLWGTLAQALIPEKIVERLKLIGVFFRLHWGQYAPPGSRDALREYPKLRKWLGSRVTFGASARLLTAELCRVFGLPAPPAFAIGSRSLAGVQVESSMTAIHVEDVGAAVQVESSITAVQIESSDATLSPAASLDPQPTVPALPLAPRSERPLVLCVHGIGDHRSGQWHQDWQEALTRSLKADGIAAPRFVFVGLDDLFQADELNLGELSDAAISFANSWLRYRSRRDSGRGLLDEAGYWLEWIPGMIAKWAGDPLLRDMLRARVADAIRGHEPTFIFGHSLGTLVCYDALSHADSKSCSDYQSAINPVHFVSMGSQIGHPSVRFVWGGRLVMPAVSTWTHLYNPHDAIFTAPVKINDSRFSQWDVTDIQGGVIDQHAAANYLGHAPLIRVALAPLFHALGSSAASDEDIGDQVRTQNAVHFSSALRNEATKQQGKQRALLVGINRHADPSWNLEGCVNDVYRISEILQTRFGYKADNIRLLIDERATAANIRERMEWLLDGADDEAQRLFYYSGHGARIPGYNALEVIDQQDEVLVPHDFSWTDPSTALVDDEFLDLYAQLPYAARFAAVFDCCHAGGMSRSGGTNVRGLTPPDDIRHRLMKFEGGVWRSRAGWEEKSAAVRAPLACSSNRPTMRRSFLGASRTLRPARDQFIEARSVRGHQGPYMPILLYACSEAQLAFEHRAGTKTHGAFTYALAELLERSEPGQLTFHDLIRSVTAEVHQLGYHQAPTIEGPSFALSLPFSF